MPEAVDILIAGGGPVGAALALALEGSGHSVVLTEALRADSHDVLRADSHDVLRADSHGGLSADSHGALSADSGGARSTQCRDARAIALSYASRLILERLHAWSGLAV